MTPTGRSARSLWAAGPLRLWAALAAGPPAFALGAMLWALSGDAGRAVGAALAAAGLLLWLLALRYLGVLVRDGLELTERVRAALDARRPVRDLDQGLREPLLGALAYSFGRVLERLYEAARAEAGERALLSAVLEAIPSGVMVIGAARQVVLVNRRCLELLGARHERPLGRYYGLLVDDPRVAGTVERALAGLEAEPLEVELRRQGAASTLWVSARPFAAAGGSGAILVVHDVTGLRRLERSRRELVAHVSHELKTPVAAILGFAETLAEGEAAPEEVPRFLQWIRREAERIGKLVDDLLRLARLESPEFTPRRQDLDAARLAGDVLQRFAVAARRRGQRLEVAVPSEPVPLRADPELLQQALANLLDNALRYTPEGGSIRLEVADEGSAVVFRVADTGPGIAPEHQERIFERFYRPDEGRSRREGGTGLGLAIVKHVAQVHGGQVGVRSRPGEGACFWIAIPRGRP